MSRAPSSAPPSAAQAMADRVFATIERIPHVEAVSGGVLLAAAVAALLLANSPVGDAFLHRWHMPLVLGKPLGIVAGTWAAVRLGTSALPQGLSWSGVRLAGLLGGIGFTRAIFIATLAFSDEAHLAAAKRAARVVSGRRTRPRVRLGARPARHPHAPGRVRGPRSLSETRATKRGSSRRGPRFRAYNSARSPSQPS